MKILLATIFLFLAMPLAAQETVMNSEGDIYVVPENRKVLIVPSHWAVKNIRYIHPSRGTLPVYGTPTTDEDDECPDELVISPATCTPRD